MSPLLFPLLLASALQPVTPSPGTCAFVTDVTDDGTLRAHVECKWDIPPTQVEAVVGPFDHHDRVFSVVKEAQGLGQDAQGRALYRHIHTAPLITDREVVLSVDRAPIPGGVRYAWEKASPQPRPGRGRIEPLVNEGYWEIREGEDGGTHLSYEAHLHPGGNLPTTLVSWLQGAALEAFFDELERAARRASG